MSLSDVLTQVLVRNRLNMYPDSSCYIQKSKCNILHYAICMKFVLKVINADQNERSKGSDLLAICSFVSEYEKYHIIS